MIEGYFKGQRARLSVGMCGVFSFSAAEGVEVFLVMNDFSQ